MAFRPHLPHRSKVPQHIRREQKEGAFVSIAAAILLDQRRGFRANPILHSLYHYYYDYYPTKAFPSLPSCFKNDDTFCNAMILETIFPTDKKWWDEGDAGHRAARPKITWYLPSIFRRIIKASFLRCLKKIFNSSEPKKISLKKIAQPQIEIVYTFAHLHFIY